MKKMSLYKFIYIPFLKNKNHIKKKKSHLVKQEKKKRTKTKQITIPGFQKEKKK